MPAKLGELPAAATYGRGDHYLSICARAQRVLGPARVKILATSVMREFLTAGYRRAPTE